MDKFTHHTIVIPTDIPWDWSTDYVNQTAIYLSKFNTVVCFFKGQSITFRSLFFRQNTQKIFYKYSKNLFHYHNIYLIPFRRFPIIEYLNTWLNIFIVKCIVTILDWNRKPGKKILWIFHPCFAKLIKQFGNTYYSLYDCTDFFPGDKLTKKEIIRITEDNTDLIRNATAVFINSYILYSLFSPLRKDIHLVPQGFRLDSFIEDSSHNFNTIPKGKPVIGYVGGINNRLDFNLIIRLVGRNKQYQFVFVGPIMHDSGYKNTEKQYAKLKTFSNVLIIPNVKKQYIPAIIRQFDIGIIPYDISVGFNRYCYPMKVLEYFYMGKPVIATPIEELKRFPTFVKLGKNIREWDDHIETLLKKTWTKRYQSKQRTIAIENSWKHKITSILKDISIN